MLTKNNLVLVAVMMMLSITGCNKWKDHTAVAQQDLSQNLLQAISSNADLSKFREYVGKAGLDTVLSSSKTFTVWAPTNAALQSLDPAVVNDAAQLRAFILNHISNQLYFVRDVTVPQRIAMLGGKYNNFSTIKFAEAALQTTDRYVANGALHTINGMAMPLQSIWEFVTSTTGVYSQNAYIAGLNYMAFDPAQAVIDSISVLTGLPVYRPGTGLVQRNYFNDRVHDLKREDKQYTYFVMVNPNFTQEADSLKNYYVSTTTTITDSLTRWNVVKDLAYDTAYTNILSMPAALKSKSGITVPVSAAFLLEVKRMSNGYVYIMSRMDVPTANKFIPVIYQGENPTGFMRTDKRGNTNYRERLNPATGVKFSDMVVSGHAVTTFYSFYRMNEAPSIRYQVYALGTNDFQAAAFSQTINAWHNELAAQQGVLTHAVPLHTATGAYNEINLGQITISRYGTVEWRLTSTAQNPIVLDYLRLVPLP